MKVHVIDNHDILVKAIVDFLVKKGIKGVTSSLSGKAGVDWLSKNKADVLLLDLSMPGFSGVDVLKYFKDNNISQKVIILSAYSDFYRINEVIGLGVDGYVLKEEVIECLYVAICSVFNGKKYFSDSVKNIVVEHGMSNGGASYDLVLSGREKQVLSMLVDSCSYEEVADSLGISTSSVRTYYGRVKQKLKVKNDLELARLIVKYNII